jgi:hypothetical protein
MHSSMLTSSDPLCHPLSVRIPQSHFTLLRRIALQRRSTINAVIEEGLALYLCHAHGRRELSLPPGPTVAPDPQGYQVLLAQHLAAKGLTVPQLAAALSGLGPDWVDAPARTLLRLLRRSPPPAALLAHIVRLLALSNDEAEVLAATAFVDQTRKVWATYRDTALIWAAAHTSA